jgi:Transposase
VAQQLWAGVDAGKAEHHCVVIDADGKRVLSRRVANDEATLGELISTVTTLADGGELTWAIDLTGGGAALLIALLLEASNYSTSPVAASITRRAVIAATLKATPKTPRSSPIRPGCAVTCSRCGPAMRSPCSCAS